MGLSVRGGKIIICLVRVSQCEKVDFEQNETDPTLINTKVCAATVETGQKKTSDAEAIEVYFPASMEVICTIACIAPGDRIPHSSKEIEEKMMHVIACN